jgi:hypothetical protein
MKMKNAAENDDRWIRDMACEVIEGYQVQLEIDKEEHPYDYNSAMIALAGLAMRFLWAYNDGERFEQAWNSVRLNVQKFIDED